MDFLDIEINEKLFIRILIVSIIVVIMYLALTMSSLLIFKSICVLISSSLVEVFGPNL